MGQILPSLSDSNSMKPPKNIYRYRPLDEAVLNRELDALENSYLFSPPFSAMNDPMEAFYETGGIGDRIVDLAFSSKGGTPITAQMYAMLQDTISRFALLSFSSTRDDLPLWAYYASNFAGICLEFDVRQLGIGDLQHEPLRQVTYAKRPLSPLTIPDVAREDAQETISARLVRKRIEWSHEREWRILTGEAGKKYYLDDALHRVFFGPRISPDHASRICATLRGRPIEILQGEIDGWNLTFRTIQEASSLNECIRVGSGIVNEDDLLLSAEEVTDFLSVPIQHLIEECRRLALHPNLHEIIGAAPHSSGKFLYIDLAYRLRSGRDVNFRLRYDRKMKPLN